VPFSRLALFLNGYLKIAGIPFVDILFSLLSGLYFCGASVAPLHFRLRGTNK
jgi:hypothetical protein